MAVTLREKPRCSLGGRSGNNLSIVLYLTFMLTLWSTSANEENVIEHDKSNTSLRFASSKRQLQRKPDYSRAYHQSNGLIDDVPSGTWELMRQRVRELPNHQNPEDPLLSANEPNVWYQMNWEPNFSCPHERRIGGMGDGPKWVCNPHRIGPLSEERAEQKKGHGCLVYSIGSFGNFAFEEAMLKMTGPCEIHVFDPEDYSAQLPTEFHEHIFHHRWGFVADSTPVKPENHKSLQETVKQLGHEGRVIDVFKIDCEGCEWSTYQDWFNSGVDIRQIQVETHYVPENANEFFETLQNEGFVTFHKEPNIWSAGGRCQEYAMVKLSQDFFQFA